MALSGAGLRFDDENLKYLLGSVPDTQVRKRSGGYRLDISRVLF